MLSTRVERTLSTPDRKNADAVAKENILQAKRLEITTMVTEEIISSEQAHVVLDAINEYVQFNGHRTKQGFERGLLEVIATHLDGLVRTATVPIY